MLLLCCIAFAVAHLQAPLYSSNQNTYLLHGIADSGYGFLKNDWLVNTVDLFPVFSLLISTTKQYLFEELFYFYHGALLALFSYSVLGISSTVYNFGKKEKIIFLIIIAFLFSAGATEILEGRDLYRDGVMGQKIFNRIFQPSAFGVFLVLAICLFLKHKTMPAIVALSVAATVHPTYLMSSACLALSFMVANYLENKRVLPALGIGLATLVLVLPVVVYTLTVFAPTSQELQIAAQEILIFERIPHHALIKLSNPLLIKFAIILAGLGLVFPHRKAFLLLFIPFAVSLILTVFQFFYNNYSLALLFPWRVSSFLVPICATLVAGKLVSATRVYLKPFKPAVFNASVYALVLTLILWGARAQNSILERDQTKSYFKLFHYVSDSKSQHDVYLVPTNLQRFRLHTGARIYVDHKSHPFKDSEVVEWFRRLKKAEKVYDTLKIADCTSIGNIELPEGITHVVFNDRMTPLAECGLEFVYNDGRYAVYEVGNQEISAGRSDRMPAPAPIQTGSINPKLNTYKKQY